MKTYTGFLIFSFVLLLTLNLSAQDRLLGEIDFPNSGAEEARADFMEGVLFLHNFEYSDAARAFRRAQEKDPEFALAYWGEAMTHNHPVWMRQYREKAMEALTKLGPTVEQRQSQALTEREKDYLMSLEVLYGNTPQSEGKTKEERDKLYMEFMKRLHEKYPDDHEITAFYGLSILGTAHEGRDYAIYMRAAAELFEVWNENPKHPGAAHYLIHSFDDPIHAPLGLPMAEAYSEIAPAAAHAQHMTSHIFLALGMWEDVIRANIIARDVQNTRERELGEETTVCGHYTWWLQYGYLQDGQPEQGAEVLETCMERIDHRNGPSGEMYSELWHFTVMRGHQVTDAEAWETARRVTFDVEPESHAATNYYFTDAYAQIKEGNTDLAGKSLETLKKAPESEQKNIQVLQIEGLLLLAEGKTEEAIALLQQAVEAESQLPIDFGPPVIIKPSYELLAEAYLQTGAYAEAREAYEQQLGRTPKRYQSLAGLDKAKNPASQ